VRLGVYTDYSYSLRNGRPYADRAFALFIDELAGQLERVVVIGRLHPDGSGRYPLNRVRLLPLPFYPSLADVVPALKGMFASLRPYWRALDELDCVWILGPHPLAFPFALIARLRGRRVVLGVRQDSLEYMRSRHPGSKLRLMLARLMEGTFRVLSRRWPVVVVGPALHSAYASGCAVQEISVSLIREREIASADTLPERDYDGELRALSVGRLENEKNPLGLADVLSELLSRDDRWRLVVCGEGPLRRRLERRLDDLGIREAAEIRGYVPHDKGLPKEYRRAHALVHVSWTEGLPQVLYEAFAAGLPVVATDVGGIAEAVGDAALLAPPGEPQRTATQLARIAADQELRRSLVLRGIELAHAHTIESETARVASFIGAGKP
jgi:glycosyltransferase involved in cell wall biosynthesis